MKSARISTAILLRNNGKVLITKLPIARVDVQVMHFQGTTGMLPCPPFASDTTAAYILFRLNSAIQSAPANTPFLI